MKKTIIIFTILSILVIGCNQKNKQMFENNQQQKFDDFLANKREMSFNQINEIQKNEFYNKFEDELFHYIDSVKLFVNWKGTIKNIEKEENGKLTAITFEIYYKPEEHREVSFYCTHITPTDSLENDYIFNIVKNIPDYTTVYFDGFIRTYNSNKINYYMNDSGKDLNIPYPDYQFWITDIGTIKRNDKLSVNLQNAINYCYTIIQPLKDNSMNKISKEESDKTFNELLPKFNELKSKLTRDEKLYVERINTCLTYNFLYGE